MVDIRDGHDHGQPARVPWIDKLYKPSGSSSRRRSREREFTTELSATAEVGDGRRLDIMVDGKQWRYSKKCILNICS